MAKKKILDRNVLYELYIVQNKSISYVSNTLGVTDSTTRKYLKKYGIVKTAEAVAVCRQNTTYDKTGFLNPMQNQSVKDKHRQMQIQSGLIKEIPEKELYAYYVVENLELSEIAKIYEVSISTIGRSLKKYNIKRIRKSKSITKERLYEYYIAQNHTIEDCASFFEVSESTIKSCINKFDIHKPKEDRLKRIKQTMLDRYGVEHALQRIESKEKFKNTLNSRNEEQCKASIQRRIKTCQERYGTNNPIQSEEIKAKARATNMQRRGCEFAMQSEEVKAKNRETLLRKYGVDNVSRVEEFKNKRTATIQDKFGVSNYGETVLPQEVRDILNSKERLVQYIEESGLRTSVDIANKIGCSFSTLNLRINKYQIRNLIDNSKSHYETEISMLLTSWGVLNYKSRTILDSHLEIDFYCPDYNIGIEFNGDYWHSSLNKPKQYHFDKSKDSQNQGVRLIHIWEHEWNDPRKRPIIESMLKIAFGKIENRIYARNCEIREITNAEAKPFNDANHLQGHRNAAVTYGLFYDNQLVQLMSFSKTKYNKNLNGDNSWEIIRGCPGSNNIVVGGVSKLFAHFIREYKPDAVFSYCDFNKFDGKGYEALGMKFIGYTGPDMKWLMPDGSVVDRSPSRHKELKEQAEAQLWGSGSKKYLWQSSKQTTKATK